MDISGVVRVKFVTAWLFLAGMENAAYLLSLLRNIPSDPDKGVYTIVAEKKVCGIPMGKLKSGKGWVSLRSKYSKKL